MTTFLGLQKSLKRFHQSFPRPGVHDLLSRLTLVKFAYEQDWPQLWADGGVLREHSEDACVYFFFDSAGELMYIGSTKKLGRRFGQHFDGKDAKWKDLTSSLAILPLPKDRWFEAPAIEAYLIKELKPPGNDVGKS